MRWRLPGGGRRELGKRLKDLSKFAERDRLGRRMGRVRQRRRVVSTIVNVLLVVAVIVFLGACVWLAWSIWRT
jgi:hypothetical protein